MLNLRAPTIAILAIWLGSQGSLCLAHDPFTARITKITDGDTVQVTRETGEMIRVRFGGIDAPESNQRLGTQATAALSALAQGKLVRVELTGIRSGNRMIGELFVPATGGNSEVDVALELVKSGHAWWFCQFANEDMPRAKLLAAPETEAKLARRGVFAEEDPIYPRVFRRGGRVAAEELVPDPNVDSQLRIAALLPNPIGRDDGAETVTIENKTSLTVSLEGWTVRDDDGGSLALGGRLEPKSRRTFTIPDSRMLALGNGGDVVTLHNADGNVVQRVVNGMAGSGDVVGVAR